MNWKPMRAVLAAVMAAVILLSCVGAGAEGEQSSIFSALAEVTRTQTLDGAAKKTASSGIVMVIKTGNSGKLHLREKASTGSRSLGLYANGTKVRVYSIQNDWALVKVGGQSGYMAVRYLAGTSQSQPSVPSLVGGKTYVVKTGNQFGLHLRQYASKGAPNLKTVANGTVLTGVDQGNGWVFVSVNGLVGFMMKSYLKVKSSSPSSPGSDTPSLSGATTRIVQTGNNGKLHLRQSASKSSLSLGLYPNGTQVKAKSVGNGWCYVKVTSNGAKGYMQSKYLADPEDVTPTSGNEPPKARTFQKHGSFVNLRSSKASMDKKNVIAQIPHNTLVKVLEWGKVYTKVKYQSMTGYIITSYLRPQY